MSPEFSLSSTETEQDTRTLEELEQSLISSFEAISSADLEQSEDIKRFKEAISSAQKAVRAIRLRPDVNDRQRRTVKFIEESNEILVYPVGSTPDGELAENQVSSAIRNLFLSLMANPSLGASLSSHEVEDDFGPRTETVLNVRSDLFCLLNTEFTYLSKRLIDVKPDVGNIRRKLHEICYSLGKPIDDLFDEEQLDQLPNALCDIFYSKNARFNGQDLEFLIENIIELISCFRFSSDDRGTYREKFHDKVNCVIRVLCKFNDIKKARPRATLTDLVGMLHKRFDVLIGF